MGFEITICETAEEVAALATRYIVEACIRRGDLLLCTATGSTPTLTYEKMVREQRLQPELFSSLRVIKLDEWVGLPMDHPSTCETYLQAHVLSPLGVTSDRYTTFDSTATSPERECERVAAALATAGPIDIAVLGLGVNGHLGLNEPSDHFQCQPHVATLAPETAQHSMLTSHSASSQVKFGLTLGMQNIRDARHVLLLVTGESKSDALAKMMACALDDPNVPASALRGHANAHCICDRQAASRLGPIAS
jgi:galactosamine-6-phosphate isomerase